MKDDLIGLQQAVRVQSRLGNWKTAQPACYLG